MSKLDGVKTLVDIASTVINAGVALADARRRAREEAERKDQAQRDADKDQRIRELEAELGRLRSK